MLWLYLLAFCRITIGLLFITSFWRKARDVAGFAQTISRFDLLPERWSYLLALLFLGAELSIVVLILIGGRLLPIAFALTVLLLFVFTLAILSVLTRNIQTSCNCFGFSPKSITYQDIWRNVGFIGCSLVGWWSFTKAPEGVIVQNWLTPAWQGLRTIGKGNEMLTILTINAILTWLVLLFTIFFMLLLAKRFRQLDQGSPKEQILKEASQRRGQPAPPFEAQNVDNETITLNTFKGKNVAFIFLSPSCKPCVEKIPALNNYYHQGVGNGTEMFIVNVDHHISSKAFSQQHGVQIPILWAPQTSNPFAFNYDAYSVPSFCLVDTNQRIRAAGHLDSRYWRDQLALR